MDEAQRTLKIVNDLLENGVDFVVEKYPVLCSEIISWGIVSHIFIIVICLLIWIPLLIFFIKVVFPDAKQTQADDLFPHVLYTAMSLIPIFAIMVNIYSMVYILIAPNLYIYQQLIQTLK